MSIPRGAIQYQCNCGARYLVALEKGAGQWLKTVEQVAHGLGLDMVDGTLPSFRCGGCGRINVRSQLVAPEPAAS